jgi:exodeoxyribonuclease VII large subunit
MPAMQQALDVGHNLPEFTVSEISQAVKRTLEQSFERVRVRGEVSKPNYHGSGHLYFSLKDENAVIDAVAWRTAVGRLQLKVEHGMEVVVSGRVSSYPNSSKYQIIIESIELAGEGALLKLLEERRKRLAAEGLFDAARKRPLPFLPDIIGVITSPTGAVIRDILHRLADRFPRHVLLWPVAVQGESAAMQVAAAIHGFNGLEPGGRVPRPDLLIVARGGGSLEDLWAFNEEAVVRAAAASLIPLISAVGHETDTTLIDFAADRRAPTPTAAAEMAVPVRAELIAETSEHGHRLAAAMTRLVAERRVRVEGLARGLVDPARLIGEMSQRLDDCVDRLFHTRRHYFGARLELLARLGAGFVTPRQLIDAKRLDLAQWLGRLQQGTERLVARSERDWARTAALLRPQALADLLHRGQMRLESLAALLDSYSYERVLARGFALIRDAADNPVTTAAAVAPGTGLRIQFGDGEVGATATGAAEPPPSRRREPARRDKRDDKQGKLL